MAANNSSFTEKKVRRIKESSLKINIVWMNICDSQLL